MCIILFRAPLDPRVRYEGPPDLLVFESGRVESSRVDANPTSLLINPFNCCQTSLLTSFFLSLPSRSDYFTSEHCALRLASPRLANALRPYTYLQRPHNTHSPFLKCIHSCPKGFPTAYNLALALVIMASPHFSLTSPFSSRASLSSTPPLASYLFHLMSLKRSNLCLSADVTTTSELLAIAEEVGDSICLLKTHADIISDFSERTVRLLKEIAERKHFLVFEDRKLGDIGSEFGFL